MSWIIQYLHWFYWIIQKVKGIFLLTEQLMRPGVCFYDLDITCTIQSSAIPHRLWDQLLSLYYPEEKQLTFLPLMHHKCSHYLVRQFSMFYTRLFFFFPGDPDRHRPVRFPLQEANVIGLLCFRVIWKLNTFLRNCFYSDCQFSAWEVYDQIVSGGFSWDSFHFWCLRTFSGVC